MEPWKTALRTALRTADDLLAQGYIEKPDLQKYRNLLVQYPLVLPRYYANLIDRSNPRCPIRLQAIPQLPELENPRGRQDPLEDLKHRPAPHITHRYPNRALVHLTPNCSMSCRFCFRKSLLGDLRSDFFEGQVDEGLQYLEATPEIEEVIFSGGDPFLAGEAFLRQALDRIRKIHAIKRVRFHSRVPVTLPMRISPAFAQLVTAHGKPTVVVVHFNHPKELTDQTREGLHTLKSAGVTLLNQSVLLREVNDNLAALMQLSERLFEFGVLPYYLHHPDSARGTAHFDITKHEGIALVDALRKRLPGYLVPRYVQDDPAYAYKREVRHTFRQKRSLNSKVSNSLDTFQ